MMNYYCPNGLLNSKPSLEHSEENSVLWLFQLILLERELSITRETHITSFKNSLSIMRYREGLFHQNPDYASKKTLENPHDAYMSPDQLIAITLGSKLLGLDYHSEVWHEIKNQGGYKYDNVHPQDSERLIHPRDWVLYGTLGGSKIARAFLFILAIACVISCMSNVNKTSGKLLAWTKTRAMNDFWEMRVSGYICDKLIKYKHGCWSSVFFRYFPYFDHPSVIAAIKVYGK